MVLSQDRSVKQETETATTTPFQESVSTFTYGANFDVIGKCEPQNLSYPGAFREVTGSMQDLAAHISKGHPWMPALLNDGSRRQQFNAKFAEVLGLDIDGGMTIDEALDHPFIGQFCGLAIESNSSTPELHKFRLVFRLDQALIGWEDIRLANEFLSEMVKAADKACKDASRFFFGAKDREPFHINESARLPEDFLQRAKEWRADQESQAKREYESAQSSRQSHPENASDNFELVREALKFIPAKTSPGDGMYPECFPILAGLVHGFSAADAEILVNEWSPTVPKSGWDVPKLIESVQRGHSGREATLGTVFHVAKMNGFKFPSQTTRKAQKRVAEARSAEKAGEGGKSYEQDLWKCLDTVDFQIGYWKTYQIDPSAEFEVDRMMSRAKESKSVNHVGLRVNEKNIEWQVFEVFVAKADFDFEVNRVLQGTDGGGMILRVQRIEGTKLNSKDVYVQSADTTTAKDFILALKRGYGQNLTSTLKNEEVQELLQNREAIYRRDGGKTYRLADRVGKQDCGTWVFKNCQFKADGTLTEEKETLIVFNDRLGQEEQIPSPEIKEQNPDALNRLVLAVEGFFGKEGVGRVLKDLGQVTAILHRDDIMRHLNHFPQSWVFGEKGAGKTFSATIAVSLAGMHHFTVSNFTVSMLYERFKSLGCLPFLVDDPIKPGRKQQDAREQLEKLLWDAYNGFGRFVRGNDQTPHTCALYTSNVAIGDGAKALISRLLMTEFPKGTLNKSVERELKDAYENASGGFSQLASIRYDHAAFREICEELRPLMESVDSRLIEALALNIFFTEKFLEKARYEFDYKGFCVDNIATQMTGYESTKDSLEDFIEKMSLMISEGDAGRWNCVDVSPRGGGHYLAIDLASVWRKFEQRYTPNYSRQSLNALILAAGGRTNEKQKFVPTELECREYLRAIAEFNRRPTEEQAAGTPPREPRKTTLRNCVMIPMELVLAQLDEKTEIEPKPGEDQQVQEEQQTTQEAQESTPDKAFRPPLPEEWSPSVNDAVLVMDGQQWDIAIVRSIPGEQSFWKVEREETDEKPSKLLTIYNLEALRPMEAFA